MSEETISQRENRILRSLINEYFKQRDGMHQSQFNKFVEIAEMQSKII